MVVNTKAHRVGGLVFWIVVYVFYFSIGVSCTGMGKSSREFGLMVKLYFLV